LQQAITKPWLKLKECLDQEDYDAIHALELECMHIDRIALKLELDYKLEDAVNNSGHRGIRHINEFLYFDADQLIGYIGICGFGNESEPLEITGMVHPQYRHLGVFSKLHVLAMAECKNRGASGMLWLCDQSSLPGKSFLKRLGARYQYSEFEMYLRKELRKMDERQTKGVHLQKATNADAYEVAKQNAVFFGSHDDGDHGGKIELQDSLPEEEEKRGMTIYLAKKDDRIIGKVHLQLINGLGGIYGFGVLPEYRGKGFGRAILLKSIKLLTDAAAKEIMLQVSADNPTALGLYKSCGFVETSVMDYHTLQ